MLFRSQQDERWQQELRAEEAAAAARTACFQRSALRAHIVTLNGENTELREENDDLKDQLEQAWAQLAKRHKGSSGRNQPADSFDDPKPDPGGSGGSSGRNQPAPIPTPTVAVVAAKKSTNRTIRFSTHDVPIIEVEVDEMRPYQYIVDDRTLKQVTSFHVSLCHCSEKGPCSCATASPTALYGSHG